MAALLRISRYPFWTGRTGSLSHAQAYCSARTKFECPVLERSGRAPASDGRCLGHL